MHRVLMLDRDLALRVGEREDPPLRDGELRIAVTAAGVCGSDLHAMATGHWVEYWPATLGHEVTGTVVESAQPGMDEGTRVVLDSRLPCGVCTGCEISPRFCTSLKWLGETRPGGFAETVVVPAAAVFAVPEGLPGELAVLAEPLAVVLSALSYPRRPPRSAVVLGFGPIGALAACEMRRRSPACELTVVEPGAQRRERALAMGVTAVESLNDADGPFDLVVDAAGYPESVNDGIEHVHAGGSIVVLALGTSHISAEASVLVEKGVEIAGSIGFEDADVERALELLAAHPEGFAPCITDRIGLDDAPAFITGGEHRSSLKAIIVPRKEAS